MKKRDLASWLSLAAVSLFCFIWTFPTMLFLCYPYILVMDAMYLAAVATVAVLSFKKTATHPDRFRKVLAVLLSLPLFLMAGTLIALGAGWIHVG